MPANRLTLEERIDKTRDLAALLRLYIGRPIEIIVDGRPIFLFGACGPRRGEDIVGTGPTKSAALHALTRKIKAVLRERIKTYQKGVEDGKL